MKPRLQAECSIASSLDELASWKDYWEEAAEAHSAIPVSSSYPWMLAWYEAFAAEGEIDAWLLKQAGRPQGILPLLRQGRALTTATNSHCPYWDAVYHDPQALLPPLVTALHQSRNEWDLLDLSSISALSPLVQSGEEHLAAAGIRCLLRPTSRILRADVTDTDTWQSTHRSLVKRVKKSRRGLERQGHLATHVHTQPKDLDELLEDFYEIEAKAWKGQTGSAIGCQQNLRRFYGQMAAHMMKRGQLAIHTLTLDGRLIAAQLWLKKNDVAYGLKTGYDTALAQYSPGQVLMLAALQDLCEDPQVRLADLGIAGPGSFKERWGDGPLQLYQLYIFGNSPRARILYQRRRLRETVRQNRLVRFLRAKCALRRRPRRQQQPQGE